MNFDFMMEVLISMVRVAVPILLVALAELYSERAGMVNIGLDGIMTFGALMGFLVCFVTGSPMLGILAGMAGGILVNMVYAFCTITLCAEQIVYGMAINIFAPAVAAFVYRQFFGISSTLVQAPLMAAVAIPGLSQIPVLGPLLFNQTPMVYLTYVLVVVTSIFFGKTRAGLSFKSVGEHPKAAETLGINVIKTKYVASLVCGALAGVGGAYLTTCYISTYSDGVVAGRGFIALSAVIFGRWSPGGIVLACLFFGFCDAMQLRLQVLNTGTPYQLFQMIPYVCTLLALAALGSKRAGPKAKGQPYRREER